MIEKVITQAADLLIRKIILSLVFVIIPLSISSQSLESKLGIDVSTKYQTVQGFGVNINPAWWLNGDYRDASVVKPAIDILIDSLGVNIFRVVIEEMDWEAVNDDNDPENFNWTYFNSVFSDSRFQGVWNTLHYLNQRGIKDGLIISFMGAPPASEPLTEPDPAKSWMGNTNFSIYPAMEDEFVESIAALLYYARNNEKINFRLVSPMNETDIVSSTKSPEHPDGIVEGPDMPDAEQYVRVIRKLAEKLDRKGMGDIRFVAPDASGEKLFSECFDIIVKDPYLLGKMACWGVHQYGNDAANYLNIIRKPINPLKIFWVTETAGIKNLLGQLDDSASAQIFWDGFDCVYQHGIRNGYGISPPNDWVYWEGEQGKPLLAFNFSDQSWTPRKQFYEFAQLFSFVKPGAVRIGSSVNNDDLTVYAFLNPNGELVIFGKNNGSYPVSVNGKINGLPLLERLSVFFTNSYVSLQQEKDIIVSDNSMSFAIPAGTIFTLTGFPGNKLDMISGIRPEPPGWYAGDMHVHRNCGEVTSIWPETSLTEMMRTNDLSVISLLADMGNGEVKESKSDLPKVTGLDAGQSSPGRIMHWDAEWHFDPEGVTFENKALGGHIVLLGLKNACKIWEESPYKILEWGKKQDAIMGFCHMQYLNDSVQSQLNCCIPIDYPVEIALGTVDFLSEDVWLNDASINAYYKILNCGFRPGWAAGTDFPCNNGFPLGSLLTYVQVNDEPLTYWKWIEGIKDGRTVVTTNGHIEFLDFKVNDSFSPGDEVNLRRKGKVNVKVTWTSILDQEGSLEIICNGKIVAKQDAITSPGNPFTLNVDLPVRESSWICARRMNSEGHQSHTAPVYITIRNKPVRASAEDAEYFVRWIENILVNIENKGPWSIYFTKDTESVIERYRKAVSIYREIAKEAVKYHN
jgi:O-glycosyl hydrolase